jgi:uncharacterized protein (DUF2384 family)
MPRPDLASEAARRARAVSRASWPVRKTTLRDESDDDLSDSTTPSERLAMMHRLALDAWASSGATRPNYTRAEMPGRVVRRGDGGSGA